MHLKKSICVSFQKAASPHTQFKYASISYKYYTDLSKHERFRKDKYFSHLRLAGLNPMAIRRVTLSGNVEIFKLNLCVYCMDIYIYIYIYIYI